MPCSPCVRPGSAAPEESERRWKKDPEHLGFAATLPLPDAIGILTSSRGLCLETRKPNPLMEVLNKRQAPVIVHPTAPAVAAPHVNEELPIPVFAYLKETSGPLRTWSLQTSLTGIRASGFCFPHAGVFLPI